MNTRWSSFTKQLFTIALLAAGVWLVFRLGVLWTPLLLVFLLSFFASYPVNLLLRRTGWPRTLVVAIVFLLLLVFIGVVAANIVPKVISLTAGLISTLRRILEEFLASSPTPIELTPKLVLDLSSFYAPLRESLSGLLETDSVTLKSLQDFLFPFASGAAEVVIRSLSWLLGAFLVVILSFYLVKDWPRIARYTLVRAPRAYRTELRLLWVELAAVWDGFIRGQFIAALVMGSAVGVVLAILGVPNAMALGLLAAVAEWIPVIGPFASAATGTVIALTFGSVWLPLTNLALALIVLGVYIALGQVQGMVVIPRVIGRRIALHPIVVIIGALAGVELLGILGVLLAAPTIATLRVLVGYGYDKLFDQDPFPGASAVADQRLIWRERSRSRDIKAVLFDLDGTLIETDDVMVRQLAHRLGFLARLFPTMQAERYARRLLMSAEVFVNGGITLLDRLHLDRPAFRLSDLLHKLRGIRPPERFVAVAGAPEMLQSLAERYTLGVVTSRNRVESLVFLEEQGLASKIAVVVSRDDTPRLKPHPMPIRLAAAQLGVTPEQCVVVGDTAVDLRAAKSAGALSVNVLCGFGERGDFDGADLVLDSTAELGAWL